MMTTVKRGDEETDILGHQPRHFKILFSPSIIDNCDAINKISMDMRCV